MPEKKTPPKAEVPEWVVTFGDLMSLLLCFFILLAAFSEIKKPRNYQEVIDSVNNATGIDGGLGLSQILEAIAENSDVSDRTEKSKRDDDKRSTNENVDPNVPGREEKVAVVQEGARHAIGASIIFEAGSYELTKRNKDMIQSQIAPKIRGQKYIIPVVGHSWGIEEKRSGLGFDELAYRRAQVVKDFLVRECAIDPAILRVESAGNAEPMSLDVGSGQGAITNRRVQVYQTGRTVDQTHPDPDFTGVGG